MSSILNNVAALGASRQLNIASQGLQRVVEKLTTGKRINRANDDAAGVSMANTLTAAVKVGMQGRRNATDGYLQMQTMDGYLEEMTNLGIRAAELESAFRGADAAGQTAVNAEYASLDTAMTAIWAKVNTVTSDAGGTAGYGSVSVTKGTYTAIGASAAGGTAAATALGQIATERGRYGAAMQQLQSYSNILGLEAENKQAQASQILDADVGLEVVNLSKWQILNQSGVSALGQANSAGQAVLGLLR
jgi:flagellin